MSNDADAAGRTFLFADECGNFDFSRRPGATKYFVLTTVCLADCQPGDDLIQLRRDLAWEGVGLTSEFHASEDKQAIRDRVFAVLARHSFRVDATILEKSKAQPQLRTDDHTFYRYAWYYHMKNVAPQIVGANDELMVVSASLGTKKKRAAFHGVVDDVIRQVSPTTAYRVANWDAQSDPCLTIADYCSWAIQRKWERGDARSYDLIKTKIFREYDLFAHGCVHYY